MRLFIINEFNQSLSLSKKSYSSPFFFLIYIALRACKYSANCLQVSRTIVNAHISNSYFYFFNINLFVHNIKLNSILSEVLVDMINCIAWIDCV